MTNCGRIFGSIYSIFGGAFVLIMAYSIWFNLIKGEAGIPIFGYIFEIDLTGGLFTITLIAGLLGVLGGILLLVDKTAGGVLVIIGGAIDLILSILLIVPLLPIPMLIIIFLVIQPIILLTGGIVGYSSGNRI